MNPRRVEPVSVPPDVDLDLPGAKSIVNRALVAAALADGTTTLHRMLLAEDTLAMVSCLQALGVEVEVDAATGRATVTGTSGRLSSGPVRLDVRQSGTTARFVLPVACLGRGPYTVDGDPQIRRRPQGELIDALIGLGAVIEPLTDPGRLPVRVDGTDFGGSSIVLPGHVSSQFVSGLLLVAPVMRGGLRIELSSAPVSAPYLTMTTSVMRAFGASVSAEGDRVFHVEGGGYRATQYEIEPDASTASYFFAAAAITGGRVSVPGLGEGSIQGDLEFVDVLAKMGAGVRRSRGSTEVRGGPGLTGVSVNMVHMSDAAPTLAAVAPYAESPTRVHGIGFIRKSKESDRVAAVVAGMNALGIEASDDGDGFTIHPGQPRAGVVETYDDHRVAMAFAVLALAAEGVEIADPACVTKTFPRFWETLDVVRTSGEPPPRVIALDGPAGSGKSTVARRLADRLGLDYLDTGAMYRSVAYAALRAGIDPEDQYRVAELARDVAIEVGDSVLVDGEDATEAIRSQPVNVAVSPVAANPGVRTVLREAQRRWARARGGGVLEGRDIGTVVFPDAVLKVYLTATAEERARRRSAQSGQVLADVRADIERRDRVDSSRDDSPLAEASDAAIVDTTGLTIDEVVDEIVSLVP